MTRTYGRLRLHNGAWAITDLEPHVALKLKAIFPKIPKHARAVFTFPADPITAEDLGWFMDRYPLLADPAAAEMLARDRGLYRAQQAEVGRIMATDYRPRDFVGLKPGQSVRLHQARAAELLARFGGLLVADDMGEGKTYTGGACCLLPGALPATVVCPPHLKGQWARKLAEFTNLTTVQVQGTRPYELPPVDVRIFGFTQIAGWIDVLELLGTGLCILDEGHELRRGVGTASQPVAKGIAAMRLAEVSRLRLMLTGTPVFNYGGEIWNLLS
ncbi:MAG TPA: SNF2-related protein, partial [Phenylobacterium sp.]